MYHLKMTTKTKEEKEFRVHGAAKGSYFTELLLLSFKKILYQAMPTPSSQDNSIAFKKLFDPAFKDNKQIELFNKMQTLI
jgi:hypothetical protein